MGTKLQTPSQTSTNLDVLACLGGEHADYLRSICSDSGAGSAFSETLASIKHMKLATMVMETRFANLHINTLPPLQARMTPLPDDLSSTSSQDASSSIVSECPGATSEPTHSGASTPNSSVKRRHGRGTSSTTSRPKLAPLKRLPLNPGIFSPRPYENLYTERAYLSAQLQQHTAKVAELMRRHSFIQAQLGDPEYANDRRRLRKQLAFLKSKINKVTEQEKVILNRFGELYMEVHSREILTEAYHQRSFSWDSYMAATPTAYSPMSPLFFGTPTPTTPLNAMSPDFVPQGYFGDAWMLSEPVPTRTEFTEPKILETVEEVGEEMLYDNNEEYEHGATEETEHTPEMRRLSCEVDTMSLRERRLSLPCLQTVWPEV